jgi:DNA-directed RNA polymerase subunit RPC12/RpoP
MAPFSRPDPSLIPIERPRCARCQSRMRLGKVEQGPDHSEKRMFECPKCSFIDIKILPDPLSAESVLRLTSSLRPPS